MIDKIKFHQAIVNIINNAIEAIRNAKQEGKIHLNISRKKNKIIITIVNNGPELNYDLPIFDAFVTDHGKTGGTGLGLAITKNFIESIKGKIESFNKDGLVHFVISLPYR